MDVELYYNFRTNTRMVANVQRHANILPYWIGSRYYRSWNICSCFQKQKIKITKKLENRKQKIENNIILNKILYYETDRKNNK